LPELTFQAIFGRMKAPMVKRGSLVILSGIAWSVVGVVLIVMALNWLAAIHRHMIILILIGTVAGVVIYRFGFSHVAAVNISRIKSLPQDREKFSLLDFQNRKSYAIIGIMVPMGYALRHSPIPKVYLIPVYSAIGLGLLLSSIRYYQGLH
jgi:hypothetical protein